MRTVQDDCLDFDLVSAWSLKRAPCKHCRLNARRFFQQLIDLAYPLLPARPLRKEHYDEEERYREIKGTAYLANFPISVKRDPARLAENPRSAVGPGKNVATGRKVPHDIQAQRHRVRQMQRGQLLAEVFRQRLRLET